MLYRLLPRATGKQGASELGQNWAALTEPFPLVPLRVVRLGVPEWEVKGGFGGGDLSGGRFCSPYLRTD